MDNYEIAEQLSLLAKLMDIHGENSFKSKIYSSAAFTIEKLPQQIASLSHEKLFQVRGIGESVGKKVIEILENGQMTALNEYIANTPSGVLEMMNIKGLGPKKINVLWKDMHIDSIDELQKASTKHSELHPVSTKECWQVSVHKIGSLCRNTDSKIETQVPRQEDGDLRRVQAPIGGYRVFGMGDHGSG
jgi:DNA polymerase/3'-5' exonuclease PolX